MNQSYGMIQRMETGTILTSGLFLSSKESFLKLTQDLSSSEALSMKHSEVEYLIEQETHEVKRRLFEEHIALRGMCDVGNKIIGIDGIIRNQKKIRKRILISLFGKVVIERMGYGASQTNSLFPKDAILNLPDDLYSHGIRKLIALEICKNSFDDTIESVKRNTGIQIPKRQTIELTIKASQDFDAYYDNACSANAIETAKTLPLIILTTDGKGVVMRKEDLRKETKKKAEKTKHKLNKRLSRGEKSNAKRMATVASVYNIDVFVRTPKQIINEFSSVKLEEITKRPRPLAKRVWASLEKSSEKVTQEIFEEALRRDPDKQKKWVCLIDGDPNQCKRVRKIAKKLKIKITIIMDIIHVIEYLWRAARVFYNENNPDAEIWVNDRLFEVLKGKAGYVAGGIRRSATLRKLSEEDRKAVDVSADYLIKKSPYLKYDKYLKEGFPIATGVIEGACRYLIKDRMDLTGARWRLKGAEAVIKLRSLKASKDFDKYWEFHEYKEHYRNHLSRYADLSVLVQNKQDCT